MKIKLLLLCCLFLLVNCSVVTFAQDKKEHKPDETNGEVVALENFHDVIYKIWHTAWPQKDVAMLAELEPEVQQLGTALVKAPLPGILRDKKKAWNDNIEKLKELMKTYKLASSPVDSQKLLDAAEQLHSQFEKLVRVVRPKLKELDDFHTTLYMIYHYYMPENNKAKLVSAVKELQTKMGVLNKATLSERMKPKEKTFTEARTKLSKSVDEVVTAVAAGENKGIKASIENMHTDYQAVEKIFE